MVQIPRRADLRDQATIHGADPVAKRHRLGLIVGDIDRGDAELAQQAVDLLPQLVAQARIQRRERFVQQQHPWTGRDGAGQGNPLPLSPG